MKYTDEDVIKALECCSEPSTKTCKELQCPLIKKCERSLDTLERFALDLIKRQKAEIDDLINKLECLLCHATGGRLSKHTYPLKVMETEVTDNMNGTYNEGYDDGIKEFAERLFELIPRFSDGYTTMECVKGAIKHLVKEMVGDSDE